MSRAQMTCYRSPGFATALLAVAVFCMQLSGSVFADTAKSVDKLWEALRNGEAFAMMRHAIAPGTGDPSNFVVGDCVTQRNLSEEGRRQARKIGERFRDNGIKAARIYSSAWCRCQDTATLLGLGPVETLTALNSFYEDMEKRVPQTDALKTWLGEIKPGTPLVLVTHQVNISALVGRPTSSGEFVVVRPDGSGKFTVLGSL